MRSRITSLHSAATCRPQAWQQPQSRVTAVLPLGSERSPRLQTVRSTCVHPHQQAHHQQQRHVVASSSTGGGSTADSPELPNASSTSAGAAASKHMSAGLYNYLLHHTREPEVLAELRANTAALYPAAAHMAVSPDQGAFMAWLVRTLGARRIIEVGVFTGYSSVAMALALPPGGTLVACDRDPKAMAVAREYWQRAGVTDKVDERLGPASATMDTLLADPKQHGSYDFAFIDADKKGYRAYYEQVLQLVRPGGVIALDNVLWYGRVADPEVQDGATVSLRELNDFLVQDERVAFSLAPVGDGMALATKL